MKAKKVILLMKEAMTFTSSAIILVLVTFIVGAVNEPVVNLAWGQHHAIPCGKQSQ